MTDEEELQEWVICRGGKFLSIPSSSGGQREAWGSLAMAVQVPTREQAEKVLEFCKIVSSPLEYRIIRLNEAKIVEIIES